VADDQWQDSVSDLMEKCCLIVFQVSYLWSEGLMWELARAFNNGSFKPVLLVFPFAHGGVGRTRDGYSDFKLWFKQATDKTMPDLPAGAAYALSQSPDFADPL
jgi:hypothetical protein